MFAEKHLSSSLDLSQKQHWFFSLYRICSDVLHLDLNLRLHSSKDNPKSVLKVQVVSGPRQVQDLLRLKIPVLRGVSSLPGIVVP